MSDFKQLDYDPGSGASADFDQIEFAENPEPRCPVLLLLDNSGSMAGEKIAQLNAGLQALKADLMQDPLAAKRCEIAVVSFGPVQQVSDFVGVTDFEPPALQPMADTPLGAAVMHGLELLRARKEAIRLGGVSLYRPWVFLITDGAPTDEWQSAAATVREGESAGSFAFFAVGVQGADMSLLAQLGTREPLMLQGVKFRELFQWLSSSLKSVSQSAPGDRVPLESPQGWAEV